jgi:AcrR family transcriptional regulator
VPRLWNQTIEAHRRDVREAILDTTWALVTEQGLLAVTMSQIAQEAGIGRATLYKYFPDVEAILSAWHERHVAAHLAHLTELREQDGDAGTRLEAVLHAYARICQHRERHGTEELGALLHGGEQVARSQQDDVAPDELAIYCVHALSAAGRLPSEAAVRRLVAVTLAALRNPR